MPLPRRAARRDENEPEVVAYLVAAGCSVERLSASGVPDLLVGYHGRNHLVEVIGPGKAKNHRARKGLTPAQVEWHGEWRGTTDTVRSLDEVQSMVRRWQKELWR